MGAQIGDGDVGDLLVADLRREAKVGLTKAREGRGDIGVDDAEHVSKAGGTVLPADGAEGACGDPRRISDRLRLRLDRGLALRLDGRRRARLDGGGGRCGENGGEAENAG